MPIKSKISPSPITAQSAMEPAPTAIVGDRPLLGKTTIAVFWRVGDDDEAGLSSSVRSAVGPERAASGTAVLAGSGVIAARVALGVTAKGKRVRNSGVTVSAGRDTSFSPATAEPGGLVAISGDSEVVIVGVAGPRVGVRVGELCRFGFWPGTAHAAAPGNNRWRLLVSR